MVFDKSQETWISTYAYRQISSALKAFAVRTTHPCSVSCTQRAQKLTSGVGREESLVVLFRKVQKKIEYLGCGATVKGHCAYKACAKVVQQGSHCKLGILWEHCSSCFGELCSGSFASWKSAASLKNSLLLLCHHTTCKNVVHLRPVELQLILAVTKSDTHLKHPCVGV